MTHYDIPKELEADAKAGKLKGPCFIGQGWSEQVGSDCYGGYVTFIGTNADGKPYYGLVGADTEFTKCWEDGSQTCTMPKDRTPEEYVVQFRGSWWKCNDKGDRFMGSYNKVRYSWNGAHSYRDPSFQLTSAKRTGIIDTLQHNGDKHYGNETCIEEAEGRDQHANAALCWHMARQQVHQAA